MISSGQFVKHAHKINHGKPEEQNIECGIDSNNIVNTVLNALGIASPAKISLERA